MKRWERNLETQQKIADNGGVQPVSMVDSSCAMEILILVSEK